MADWIDSLVCICLWKSDVSFCLKNPIDMFPAPNPPDPNVWFPGIVIVWNPVGVETGAAAFAMREAMIATMNAKNNQVEMAASMEEVVFLIAVENSRLKASQKAK
jgi:hypothetical protein